MLSKFLCNTDAMVPKKQSSGQKRTLKKFFVNLNKRIEKCMK